MIIAFDDITVEIAEVAMKTLLKHEQIDGRGEAGGILLGKYLPEREYYLISEATEPTNEDESGPLSFKRSCKSAQKIINERWSESEGVINYLGEWHTHPWKNPNPSEVDKSLMKQLIHDGSNVWKHLIMIIVGTNNTLFLGVSDSEHKGKIVRKKHIGGFDASVFN